MHVAGGNNWNSKLHDHLYRYRLRQCGNHRYLHSLFNGHRSLLQSTELTGYFASSPCSLIPGTILGTASCQASFTPSASGTANINATYTPSDQSHSTSAATSTAAISISLRVTTTTVSCSSPVIVNQPSTCTAT